MIQVASKCSKKKDGWLFFFQFITFLWTTNQCTDQKGNAALPREASDIR
jgi:hypothetical protein